MKKFGMFSITVLLILVVFSGCQNENNQKNNQNDILQLKEDIKEINVFKSNKSTKEDLITSFVDMEIIKTVKNIINSANKQAGIVNTTDPNYNIEIIYENDKKEKLNLWLRKDEKGSLMNVEETHILYNLSEEMSDNLYDLIHSE